MTDRIKRMLENLTPEQRALVERRMLQERAKESRAASIPRRTDRRQAPMSFAQQRMWFLEQLAPGNPAHHIADAFLIESEIDVALLRRCLNELVRRHEALRTTFRVDDGEPVQVIADAIELDVSEARVPASEAGDDAEARRLLVEESARPFDLENGPLVRVKLVRIGEETGVLVLTMHHIISDAWSRAVFLRELLGLYDAFREGRSGSLPELPIQYGDFAAWQRQWLEDERLDRQMEFWKRQLAGLSTLQLPVDHPRPALPGHRGRRVHRVFPARVSRAVRDLCREEGVTVFMLMLAVLDVLLKHYGGQDDVVVGTPVAGRNREEIEGVIGFFVNMLVMRTDLSGDPTFRSLVRRARDVAVTAQEHQDLPFEKLVEEIDPVRDTSRSPLFQVAYQYLKVEDTSDGTPALALRPVKLDLETTRFDLEVHAWESGDDLGVVFVYRTDLFEASTVERWAAHFDALLDGLVSAPDRRISEIPLLTGDERHRVLTRWNVTEQPFPDNCAIHEIFEEWVRQTPDADAAVFEDERLTYRELNRRANRIAHLLIEKGVAPDVPVGICTDRGLDMVAGILGILKAGGAYVPLDPGYPPERLAFMLQDSGVALVLTQEHLLSELPEHDAEIVCLDGDGDRAAMAACSENDPPRTAGPDHLAYVIYTSGSTGTPKGTLLAHRGLCNLSQEQGRTFGVGPGTRVLQFSSLSFDASTFDIMMALPKGGTLFLGRLESIMPGPDLLQFLRGHAIEIVTLPPTALASIPVEDLPDLKTITVAGEACSAEIVSRWAPGRAFFNLYGPTEATIWSTTARLEADGEATHIGRPVANTRVYVLDEHLQPVPVGVPGELHIGGTGLARGYHGRPDLTAERFVPDPFSDAPGGRLYRTGDLVRYRRDDNLEFLGRIDHQVKLRGFRIEPGEIEAALVQHAGVREAIVLCREDAPGDKQLVAYVVGDSGDDVLPGELRSHLGESLPEYMLPSAFVVLDAMPVTPNGKVDRRALPPPSRDRQATETYVAPRSELEERVAAIWCEVLGIEQVGVRDNFFDLGGHSLRLVQVHGRLRQELGSELSVTDLFRYPTVESVVEALSEGPDAGPARSLKSEALARIRKSRTHENNAVAVIGMAGRFPGAPDVETLWSNLLAGEESIRFFNDDELREAGVSDALLAHPDYVKARAVLDDADRFDARLFGYTPREAELIDPQQRVFLECAWEALERAGYDPQRYRGMVGVYAGASLNTYLLNILSHPELLASGGGLSAVISNDKDYLPTRVSYKLDLRGPSMNVQTACSTSLVALHQAYRSLLDYQCDVALAGGVAVSMPSVAGYMHQEGGILSPDGRCRAFDARANGMLRGDGVGIVVLKRLDEALRDGDEIHAVVRGTAINNDGSGKVGYTAPSVQGQAEVIALAQAFAGVDPETIGFVEAHGTGTALGDPIEVAALTRVFRETTQTNGFCGLGSLKTNIGHLDAAAGVAGLIKAVLALKHRKLPPSLHFETPNPEIDFENSPFYVVAESRDWEAPEEHPRRAGVSSFGLGGTNAHAVLEEAPAIEPSGPSRPWQLLVLSARSRAALDAATSNLAAWLRDHEDVPLADVAHTLQVGRRELEHRRAVVCHGVPDAVESLEGGGPDRSLASHTPATERPVVFLFPGQGAQYVDMGLGLYEDEPVFQDAVEECLDVLETAAGLNLRPALYPDGGVSEEASARLKQTEVTQPALFVVEYALSRLWRSWGIEPEACIGHSIGEYVAACVSGVLELPDVLRLVAERGRLMGAMPPGVMLAVPLPEERVAALLAEEDALWLSTVNAPSMCVVSGTAERAESFAARMSADGVECRRLHTSHAFHSGLMDDAVAPFVEAVRGVTLGVPQIPYLSNVTGDWATAELVQDPEYWGRQIRMAVRFSDGMEQLLGDPKRVLLEVGPGQVLGSLAKRHEACGRDRVVVSSLRQPRADVPDTAFLAAALGRLWTGGVRVDWSRLREGERRRRVTLPTYPFERESYWVGRGAAAIATAAAPSSSATATAADSDGQPAEAQTTPTYAAHPRPDLATEYEAPRDDTERALAEVWQRLFGIDRIGIHDSFFDLGGDSVLGMQIVSCAKDAGIRVTTDAIFTHQTIAELATVAEVRAAAPAADLEQGAVTGDVPLTPIQHWFFDLDLEDERHFNQAVLLTVKGRREPEEWERIARALVEHHDALRMRYVRDGSGRRQTIPAPEDGVPFAFVDLAGVPPAERSAAIEARTAELQASLSLTEGPLVRVAVFDAGPEEPQRLFVVVHHLAMDAISWPILLGDVAHLLDRQGREAPFDLPPKTTSFQAWSRRLNEHAQSPAVAEELDYWTGLPWHKVAALPVDHASGSITVGVCESVALSLDEDETRALLQRVPHAYRTQINDVLLTALVQAFAPWTGRSSLLVEMEGHGREDLFDDVNLSRTVGWFTSMYPVILDVEGAEDPAAALKRVKEQLRAVPGRGIGYGLLRYLHADPAVVRKLRALPAAEVNFLYLGHGGQGSGDEGVLTGAPESIGPTRSPRNGRAHLFEIMSSAESGRFRMQWSFCTEVHDRGTVEKLAERYVAALRALIAHCTSEEAGGLTPSDFPLATLEQGAVDQLEQRHGANDIEDVYALSPMQQGMLFHGLLEPASGVYIEQIRSEQENLDVASFRRAWEQVLARHSVLRTSFDGVEWTEPVQVVRRELPLPLTEHDCSALSPEERQGWIDDFLRADRQRGFDLAEPPLMRIALIRVADDRHVVVFTFHHILFDGWSLPIVLHESFALYAAYRAGEDVDLPRPRPFRDYIAWLRSQDEASAESFWRERLRGFDSSTGIGADRSAAERKGIERYEEQLLALSPQTTRALQALANRSHVTLNTVVLGAWSLLLHRYTGDDDVVFGTTVSGRPADLSGVESMVGLFINTLPMRAHVPRDASLTTWLRALQAAQLEQQSYEHSPLWRVQQWSDVPSGMQLFESLFIFENFLQKSAGSVTPAPGEQRVQVRTGIERTGYPLLLAVMPRESLQVQMTYDRGRFDPETIERMRGHLANLLESIAAHEDGMLADLEILGDDERRRLVVEWNDTAVEFPGEACLHELFEAQVERTPDAIAVAFEDRRLTYRELNARANRLAHHLRSLGVGTETLVGICAERSPELVAGLLGILKAGAAYVPLDPGYPADRLAFMLRDARTPVVLVQERFANTLAGYAGRVVGMDAESDAIARESTANPRAEARPADLAYTIYTSGSTGTPKGAMNQHTGVCNRLRWIQATHPLTGADRVLQKTPFSFDVSVWEFFWPLVSGARLVLARPEGHKDPEYLVETIAEHGITTIHFVPSMLRAFLEAPDLAPARGLRRVLCSGEALPFDLQQRFFSRLDAELHNLYGPTEAAIEVTAWECRRDTEDRSVPIGRPIANTSIHVLDRSLQPVPVGAPGELHIGGIQVARGYWKRPGLTAERFVPDPFGHAEGGRLYKTGDLARFRPDGTVEFLGRLDHQVKLRGFRIEPGEIEGVLSRHPRIREAVVVVRDEASGEGYLAAYTVPAGDGAPEIAELREHLLASLPDYMVPAVFVTLDAIPLTPSGKIDRRALPEPQADRRSEGAFVAPRSDLEERIAAIWCAVLNVERVGARDNFFELGGHSIRLLQVHTRLKAELGCDLSVTDMFRYPTVESLAIRLAGTAELDHLERLDARARVGRLHGTGEEAIAVIAMAGRFPGATDVETFWENLRDGVESVKFYTPAELEEAGVPVGVRDHPSYVPARAALDGADLFDAWFFGFNPREAELIDPQHRVLLECAWESLETAGYDPERYPGMIGVFAGASMNTYLANLQSNPEVAASAGGLQIVMSSDKDHLPTRVSYKLNLRGPSVNVQAACSTSLVAVHEACQSLLDQRCDMALAAGVSVTSPLVGGYVYQEGGIGSADGHCRAFDARAGGSVNGDGVAVVVLKRLSEALRDGDDIHAVILGSAVNNDGSNKVGYAAPSVEGQAEVVALAQAFAGVDPQTISYVEAHGTGTALGDPIEIAALTKAFRLSTEKTGFCGIGSLKTNVGHLDAAAGVTSLIKTVLALKHRQLPPSLHFEEPNPEIDFEDSPFYVNTACCDWYSEDGAARRAGVHTFGIGGTNAHVVLQEAPHLEPSGPSRPWQVLVLSAKSARALDLAAENLAEYLRRHGDANLADVAHTLQAGRAEFEHRRAVVCRDVAGALAGLEHTTPEHAWSGRTPAGSHLVAFMFPGAGSEDIWLGSELYREERAYREAVDACLSFLSPHSASALRRSLDPGDAAHGGAAGGPSPSLPAEVALFVAEYALARLWRSWGIEPEICIGEGTGEYAAACISGILEPQEALSLLTAVSGAPAPAVEPSPPEIPCVSSMTGDWLTESEALDPAFWQPANRNASRLAEALAKVLSDPHRVLLEVGPGEALGTLVRRQPGVGAGRAVIASVRDPENEGADTELLAASLARLWVSGASVDWSRYRDGERRRRVPLPTYPFQRERFWVEPAAGPERRQLYKRADVAEWFYLPVWKQTSPVHLGEAAEGEDRQSWLVLADETGVSDALFDRLAQAGQRVIRASAGEGFREHGPDRFSLDPREPLDYVRLLERVRDSGAMPAHVVHAWTLAGVDATADGHDAELDGGFFGLLHLVQALDKTGEDSPVEITVATRGAQQVLGHETLRPGTAALHGLSLTVPQELPHVACRTVDLDTPGGADGAERSAAMLIAETRSRSEDMTVAYRGRQRWAQTFDAIRLAREGPGDVPLRKGGVYLISGGLGRIGLEIAAWLAETVQAKLVLAGRSRFPLHEEWDDWLDGHAADDPVSRKIRRLRAMEEHGAEVMIARADVANAAEVRDVVERASERFGDVHGVVHAAGVLSGPSIGSIRNLDRDACAAQFRSKVHGLVALDEALRDRALDFRTVTSSISTVTGAPGLAAYASANAFMDAFACESTRSGTTPWLSVKWDGWRFDSELDVEAEADWGVARFTMEPGEGVDAFGRVLRLREIPQIVVSTGDLLARRSEWVRRRSVGELHERPDHLADYVKPRNAIERRLARIWQTLLGIDKVGRHDNFYELGGDSFLGIQIVARANDAGIRLTPAELYERQTIAELAEVADAGRHVEAEQGPVTGDVPLTPIQRWFLERDLVDPQHFNQARLFTVLRPVTPAICRQALTRLLDHHDALRMRYERSDGEWRQVGGELGSEVAFEHVDLTHLVPAEQAQALAARAGELQASLGLHEGPLLRAAWFDLGASRPPRLLIAIHHLAVDGVSWWVLLEDLKRLCEQLGREGEMRLPAKTTSFRQWGLRLGEHARSTPVESELEYWLGLPWDEVAALPVDRDAAASTVASSAQLAVTLSEDETRDLLQEVPRAYNTQINDVLLAALLQSFAGWTGRKALLVDLEGHGREDLFEDVDITRTVGWFTTLFPVLLDATVVPDLSSDPGAVLKRVKEQLRAVPGRGLGYGLLRHLHPDRAVVERLHHLPQAQVSFNYMGQLDPMYGEDPMFGPANEAIGSMVGSRNARSHKIEVGGSVVGGRLRIDWGYGATTHDRETIERLAEDYASALRGMIEHCRSMKDQEFTPSDFPLADLDEDELGRLAALIDDEE